MWYCPWEEYEPLVRSLRGANTSPRFWEEEEPAALKCPRCRWILEDEYFEGFDAHGEYESGIWYRCDHCGLEEVELDDEHGPAEGPTQLPWRVSLFALTAAFKS